MKFGFLGVISFKWNRKMNCFFIFEIFQDRGYSVVYGKTSDNCGLSINYNTIKYARRIRYMDNRDIFDFDFIDRKKQEAIAQNFLANDSIDNFLWIDGESGIGKSFFIEKRIVPLSTNYISALISLPSETKDVNCIQEILKVLQSQNSKKIIVFLKTNYPFIFDTVKKSVLELAKKADKDISWFIDILFDTGKYFEDRKGEKLSTTRVIIEYINEILENKKLFLVIDNFTNCDKKSLNIIKSI